MTRLTNATVLPEDVRATAAACRGALKPVAEEDLDRLAGGLEWSCRTILTHILSALLYYAIDFATRSTERRFSGRADHSPAWVRPLPDDLLHLRQRLPPRGRANCSGNKA